MALEKLNAEDIQNLISVMSGDKSKIQIIIKDCINSTNDYALEQISSKVFNPQTVILAETQTSGKGRQGRVWVSPPGNILLSLYWQFHCDLTGLYGLSLAVGIAIARVLKNNGLEDVQLKWPNDIFWQERKMGGILIETKQSKAGLIDAVIGIGLNVQSIDNYQGQINQQACALEDALQHKVYRNRLVAQLLFELNSVLNEFSVSGFDAFVEEWKKFDSNQGKIGLIDKINKIEKIDKIEKIEKLEKIDKTK